MLGGLVVLEVGGGRGRCDHLGNRHRNTKRSISVSLYFNLHICVAGVTLNEDHLFMLIYYYTDLFLMSCALSMLGGRGEIQSRATWLNEYSG